MILMRWSASILRPRRSRIGGEDGVSGTVLVTGAGGFVGSAVVRALVRPGAGNRPTFPDGSPVEHVVAVLRPGGSQVRLSELAGRNGWSTAEVDLTDRREVLELFSRARPRAVLHLASDRAIHDATGERERERLHLDPLRTLFDGLADVPGSRLIHTSSAWALPPGFALDETTALAPMSAYGRAKAHADEMLPLLETRTGVPWVNLRLFNLFGRYEDESRLLPYVASQLLSRRPAELSSPELLRDFSDVDDVAGVYLAALGAGDECCGAVYHVGSGRGVTIRQFAESVAAVTGHADLLRWGARVAPDADLPCQVADPRLAARVLGWNPVPTVEERIWATVEWWIDRWGRRVDGEDKVLRR